MIFPLLRTWFKPLFGSALSSTPTPYKHPSGFRTIGGGDGESRSAVSRRRGPTSGSRSGVNTSLSFTESEERIIHDVKMQNLHVSVAPASALKPPKGIAVSTEFELSEDRTSQAGEQKAQRVHESW